MPSSYRQSDNIALYREQAELLVADGSAFYCQCSRKEITALSPEGHSELCYPGTCRELGLSDDSDRGLRFRIEDNTQITFDDVMHGMQIQTPAHQGGDLLLRDRVGLYTYNYAVVVDDIRHGVNLVVRGTDLIHCTGRQKMLTQHISDKQNMCYVHHPLIFDADGKKLSKRDHSEALRARRARGETPEEVIGEALFAAGLIQSKQSIPLADVPAIITGDHDAC